MDEREKKVKITLSALLHDIGKFYQRTGQKLDNTYYENFMKQNGYKHASYTAQFIAKFLDEKFESILLPAAEHHVVLKSIVKTADIYASAHDRKSEEEYHSEEENSNYITDRLNSIFYVLFEASKMKETKETYINIGQYSKHFPSERLNFKGIDDCKQEYNKLFKDMIERFKDVKDFDYLSLHHQIYPILAEYTSTIPSSTYKVNVPTIGLFDHAKLTAALANCIQEFDNDKVKLMIVDYDMSGIQAFIYKIAEGNKTKQKVAKSLRARSFYLNMLCDFIAYSIIREFNLTYENVLYTSGGRGQVLIPYTSKTKEKLDNLVGKITKELYKVHKNEISFVFNSIEINLEDLQVANFKNEIYGENKKVLTRKNQKLLYLLKDPDFDFISKPLKNDCKLCNTYEAVKDDMCSFCSNLLKFNDDILVKIDEFVVEFDYEDSRSSSNIAFQIGSLGKIIIHSKDELNHINSKSYYESINCNIIGVPKFYASLNIGNKTFEDIAYMSEGDSKLAVIKMDVDNLGWIFNNGFQDDKYSFSKILTLSRNMDFFFSKIIVDICNDKKYKNSIYIIYSGGDDVAVVIPASMSLEFINDINLAFKKYTGNNKELHLSSGIEIFLPKSPVRFAINRADDNLANAKSQDGKNSIGILDCILSNDRLSHVLKEIKSYKEAIENEELSRTSLYNLYLSIKLSLDNKTNPKAFQKFIPQIAYSISRNIPNNSKWFEIIKNTFIVSNISKEVLNEYKIIYSFILMMTREEK